MIVLVCLCMIVVRLLSSCGVFVWLVMGSVCRFDSDVIWYCGVCVMIG